jgi:hypothetical protein
MVAGAADELFPKMVEALVLVGDLNELRFHVVHKSVSMEEIADWVAEGLAAMIGAREDDSDAESEAEDEDHEDEDDEDPGNEEHGDHEDSVDEDSGAPDHKGGTEQNQTGDDGDDGSRDEQEEDYAADYVYPNLKVVYIDPWDERTPEQRGPKLWLQKTIEAGLKRGVEVRTIVNVNPYTSRVDLYVPPDRFDMRCDLEVPHNEIFDPMTGQWTERGCRACGKCESCLELFNHDVWKQAYKAAIEERLEPESKTPNEVWTSYWEEREEDGRRVRNRAIRVQDLTEYQQNRNCKAERRHAEDLQGVPPPAIAFPQTRRLQAMKLQKSG